MRCPWMENKTIKKDGMGYEYEWNEWKECYKEECPFYRFETIKVQQEYRASEVHGIEYCMRTKA